MTIQENTQVLLSSLPEGVTVVAASKTRTVDELLEAHRGGVHIFGENYVQEACEKFQALGKEVQWHFIGHLQANKVRKAIQIFDMIETIDSLALAEKIEKECRLQSKVMPVLVEVNSGGEAQKTGVSIEKLFEFCRILMRDFSFVCLQGLMTMGPYVVSPESIRPYFRKTKELFVRLQELYPSSIKFLSMGMSDTYRIALEEGANIVRIGTKIFGPRSL